MTNLSQGHAKHQLASRVQTRRHTRHGRLLWLVDVVSQVPRAWCTFFAFVHFLGLGESHLQGHFGSRRTTTRAWCGQSATSEVRYGGGCCRLTNGHFATHRIGGRSRGRGCGTSTTRRRGHVEHFFHHGQIFGANFHQTVHRVSLTHDAARYRKVRARIDISVTACLLLFIVGQGPGAGLVVHFARNKVRLVFKQVGRGHIVLIPETAGCIQDGQCGLFTSRRRAGCRRRGRHFLHGIHRPTFGCRRRARQRGAAPRGRGRCDSRSSHTDTRRRGDDHAIGQRILDQRRQDRVACG